VKTLPSPGAETDPAERDVTMALFRHPSVTRQQALEVVRVMGWERSLDNRAAQAHEKAAALNDTDVIDWAVEGILQYLDAKKLGLNDLPTLVCDFYVMALEDESLPQNVIVEEKAMFT
jgi:hypothetical protein